MTIDSRLKPILDILQAAGYRWILVGIVPKNAHRDVRPTARWISVTDWIPHGRALVEMGCNGDGQRVEFWLDESNSEHRSCVRERFVYPDIANRAGARRAIWPVSKELP